MDGGVVTFIVAVVIIAILMIIAMRLTKKRAHKFDKEEYQTRFLKIENRLNKERPETWAMTIINGDKLLDKALTEMGVPGKTMGDRLKKAGEKFTDVNAVWRAHKLRNVIAHEDDLEVSYAQASNVLVIYKQALKDLEAI